MLQMTLEEAGKYFPEGFEGHGHFEPSSSVNPLVAYDLTVTPPRCLLCQPSVIEELLNLWFPSKEE